MANKFKFSVLRQFGSENISFTSEIESPNQALTEDELLKQIEQIDTVINSAFIAVNEREISEKDILAGYSERRREAVAKLDQALKLEMTQKAKAKLTMQEAENLQRKLDKIGK